MRKLIAILAIILALSGDSIVRAHSNVRFSDPDLYLWQFGVKKSIPRN